MTVSLARSLVYLITLGRSTPANFTKTRLEILDVVRTAVYEQVDLIQIREKQLPAKLLFELVEAAADIRHGTTTRVLVNDRADIGLAAGADGVHLASYSIPASVIRASFPDWFLIGVSTHTIEDVLSAARDSANFAVFGPVYKTPGKDDVAGLKSLSQACGRVEPFPVLGLGGVDAANCEAVIALGASGVAGIRAFNDITELRSICRKLKK